MKVYIFCGEYGSGKTQVSVNYSIDLAKKHDVSIVDLDIVNPYFRARDNTKKLENSGVKVIFNKHLAQADLPALPPEVLSAFEKNDSVSVFDVGGDDGSVVLGRYSKHLKNADHELFMVVNGNRPFTSSVEGIRELKDRIERLSKLKVTGLINNTNVGELTEAEQVLEGEKLTLKAGQELNIPVIFTAVRKDMISEVEGELSTKAFPLDIEYKLPW
ncbi:ATP-binding protein [Proteinivorax hydrogeniformans]|uniref:ATP-binding protein n=1 Tax=Proteinivorax hydrogeniformans TaxID=1826727 RepID=A0AAU8HQD3_9FIRM